MTIASGSGYWLENSPPTLRRAWWLWFFAVPLALPLFGYFPGKKLRKVGDLPKGVMAQWRRWCLNREYAVGAEGEEARQAYAEVRTPMVSLSFADDEMMSLRNTESLHSFYRNAPKTMKRLARRTSTTDRPLRLLPHPLPRLPLAGVPLPELGSRPERSAKRRILSRIRWRALQSLQGPGRAREQDGPMISYDLWGGCHVARTL